MFGNLLDKQRRALSVVKTALFNVGITGRSVCVKVDFWFDQCGQRVDYAVFVASPYGSNDEPFYTSGTSMVEAVKKTVDLIKGRTNNATKDVSEVAPF